MRKSIFERVQEEKHLWEDLQRIGILFEKVVYEIDRTDANYPIENIVTGTIESYFEEYVFSTWKQRGTCISLFDFKEKIQVDVFLQHGTDDVNLIMDCLEYVLTLFHIVQPKLLSSDEIDVNSELSTMLESNCQSLLSELNLEFVFFEDEEKGLVIEKNPSATAVADILEPDLCFDVINYNHYLLKGNLLEKKSILKKFDSLLEPRRADLKSLNSKLEDDLYFGLNNLHIRHNNVDENGTKYKKCVAELNDEELEMWYDEVYQLILLAFLLLDNTDRHDKFDELKKRMSGGNT